VCLALCLALVPAVVVAAAGGMPAAHGVDGGAFGQLVSEMAKTEPGAVAAHVGECKGEDPVGGMPALHEVDGQTFGQMVKDLATSEPGAVAAHIGECAAEPEVPEAPEVTVPEDAAAGGIPAIHGINGKDFGAAASAMAEGEPRAVAAHLGAPVPCE